MNLIFSNIKEIQFFFTFRKLIMNKGKRHLNINMPLNTPSNISGIIIQNEFEIHSIETALWNTLDFCENSISSFRL